MNYVNLSWEGLDDEAESGSSSKSMRLTFRSYEPQNDLGNKRDDVDLFAVEKEIADQLADTQDTKAVEQIDITTLAPRKVRLLNFFSFSYFLFFFCQTRHVNCFENIVLVNSYELLANSKTTSKFI